MGGKAERPRDGQHPDQARSGIVPREVRKEMIRLALTGSDVRTRDDVQRIYCGQGVQGSGKASSPAQV